MTDYLLHIGRCEYADTVFPGNQGTWRHGVIGPPRSPLEKIHQALSPSFQPHDVPILMAARLLSPLGNPPLNSAKFIAMLELLEQIEDWARLAKVTNGLNQHWQRRNAAKKNGLTNSFVKPLIISELKT